MEASLGSGTYVSVVPRYGEQTPNIQAGKGRQYKQQTAQGNQMRGAVTQTTHQPAVCALACDFNTPIHLAQLHRRYLCV